MAHSIANKLYKASKSLVKQCTCVCALYVRIFIDVFRCFADFFEYHPCK